MTLTRQTQMQLVFSAACAAVWLILSADLLAQQPWHQPVAYSKLTQRQKDWLVSQAKWKTQIRALYDNNINEAVARSEKLYKYDEEVFTPVHDETARSLDFLADTYYRQEDFRAAATCKFRTIEIYEQLYGANNWRVLSVRYQLRVWYEMQKEGRRGFRDYWGDTHKLYDKAIAVKGKEQYAAAIPLLTTVAARYAEVLQKLEIPVIENIDYADTLKAIGECYRGLSRYTEAEQTQRDVLKIYAKVYGVEHPLYADCLLELARTQRTRGDYAQAELAMRQAIEVLQASYGGPHRMIASVQIDLGRLYADQNQNALAQTILLQALETNSKTDEPFKWAEQRILRELSSSYMQSGQLDKAAEYIHKSLELTAKTYGKETLDYAVVLHQQANIAFSRGKYAEALQDYRICLDLAAKVLGKEHADYATYLQGVAMAQRKLNQIDEAEKNMLAVVTLQRKKLGNLHPYTQNALTEYNALLLELAAALAEKNDLPGAQKAISRLVAMAVSVYPAPHWKRGIVQAEQEYFETASKLDETQRKRLFQARKDYERGETLFGEGKLPEAITTAEQAANALRELLPPNSGITADASLRLAHLYRHANRNADSERLYRDTVEVYKQGWKGRELPPSYGTCLYRMAGYCNARGEWAAASKLYDQTRDLWRETDSAIGNDYANVTTELGHVCRNLGDLQRAEALFQEVADIRLKVVGKQSPLYADALENLATVLRVGSQPEQAEPLYQAALAIVAPTDDQPSKRWLLLRNHLGLLYRQMKKHDEALKIFTEAGEAYGKAFGKEDYNYASFVSNQGTVLFELGKYQEAEPLLREAFNLFGRLGHRVERVALRHVTICETWANQRRHKDDLAGMVAMWKYLVDVETTKLGENHWKYHQSRLELKAAESIAKFSAMQLTQLHKADKQFTEYLELFKSQKYAEAVVIGNQLEQAYAQLLEPTCYDRLFFLTFLALGRARAGDHRGAEANLQDALKNSELALPQPHLFTAQVLQKLGELQLQADDPAAAVELLKRATDMAAVSAGKTAPEYAAILTQYARAQHRLGQLTEADRNLQTALNIFRPQQSDFMADYCTALQVNARLQRSLGDLNAAGKAMLLSRQLSERYLGMGQLVTQYSIQLSGEIEAPLGPNEQRPPLTEETLPLSILKATDKVFKATLGAESLVYVETQWPLVNHLIAQGPYADAQATLTAMQTVTRKVLGEENVAMANLYHKLGLVAFFKGDFAQAETLMQQGLELRKKLSGANSLAFASSLQDLGDLQLQLGKPEKAEPFYRQHLELVRQQVDAASLAQSEQQQIALSNQMRTALDRYLSLPANVVDLTQVYGHVCAWKGAVFARQELMRAARTDPELAPLFQHWENTTGALATHALRLPYPEEESLWQTRVEALSRQKDALEIELATKTSAKVTPVAFSVEKLRQALPPGVALLDFLVYERRSPNTERRGDWIFTPQLMAFVIRSDQPPQRVELGNARELGSLIGQWLLADSEWNAYFSALEYGNPAEQAAAIEKSDVGDPRKAFEEQNEKLRSALLLPLRAHWEGIKTLLISPDGPLVGMPFMALPGTRPGTYLMEEMGVVVAPVPRLLPTLLATQPEQVATPSLALFGDIDYDAPPEKRKRADEQYVGATLFGRAGMQKLKSTGPEVDALNKLFARAYPQGKAALYKDATATENNFRAIASKQRWIHLATHGFYSDHLVQRALGFIPQVEVMEPIQRSGGGRRVPQGALHPGLMAGLAFSGANEANNVDQDDGVLSAMEVSAMNLSQVDLAVLSACETAVGKSASGEGVLGMQRAFQVAGVRTVVSTLWSVDDRATQLLMERFYSNLLIKKMTKLQALQEAQLWMLTAARRGGGKTIDLKTLSAESQNLPPRYRLPNCWAPFVLSGDWR